MATDEKHIIFVDMLRREHEATTRDVIVGPDVDRIDVTFMRNGIEHHEFDVPKETPNSRRFYWYPVRRKGKRK